ncbi:MAG TPA: HAMP domain-containing sensor histidine kinase [Actinomycetota bacterium]
MTEDKDAYERLQRRYERERTARREAEAIAERVTAELYSATENLQAANQAIRDFMAIASHDLKSPLTSIIGAASMLRESWRVLTDEQREGLLEAATRQGTHMSRMVDDLLTISKIESGALEPHPAAVELRRAIDRVVGAFIDWAGQVRVSALNSISAECDPDHLERILTNYIGNAIKYGAPPIHVEAEQADEWVEIRVRDHGAGVPDDFVPRLFGRFSRADDARTRSQPGSGLGLSIVQGLARMNGGDTWYEPNDPNGSCFAVRLRRSVA